MWDNVRKPINHILREIKLCKHCWSSVELLLKMTWKSHTRLSSHDALLKKPIKWDVLKVLFSIKNPSVDPKCVLTCKPCFSWTLIERKTHVHEQNKNKKSCNTSDWGNFFGSQEKDHNVQHQTLMIIQVPLIRDTFKLLSFEIQSLHCLFSKSISFVWSIHTLSVKHRYAFCLITKWFWTLNFWKTQVKYCRTDDDVRKEVFSNFKLLCLFLRSFCLVTPPFKLLFFERTYFMK